MWNIHRLLNQKREFTLGYQEVYWLNVFIHSQKNSLKVKIKCQKKIAAALFYCTYNAASGAHAAQRLWSHSL